MNYTLRTWLEWLFGIEDAVAGEGSDWELTAPGMWSPSALVLFLLFVVVFLIAIYLREGIAARRWKLLLAGVRLLLIGLLLFMIFEVQVSIERTGLPHIPILVDTSASMGEIDQYEDRELAEEILTALEKVKLESPDRLNQAKALLLADDGKVLRRLGKDYKIDLYYVSTGLERPGQETAAEEKFTREAEIENLIASIRKQQPLGTQSKLGQGVRDVLNELRGSQPTALVMFTDGITTEGESLAQVAQYADRKGVPLYLIGLGTEQPKKDIRIGEILVDEVVFVDDIVYFEFPVTATGYQQKELEVTLREKNKPEVLARQKITLGSDGEPQRIRLPYRPTEVGDFEYVVEIPVLKDETDRENNSRSRKVSVRKEQIKVLLVEDKPRFEFRYLKNLLERDKTVELDTILQGADPEWANLDRSALRPNVFPVSKEQLYEYHVLIFGDVNPAFLSPAMLQNIESFVKEQGGGVVFIAGPRYMPLGYRTTPLADLFPLDLNGASTPAPDEAISSGFRVSVTDFGWSSPHLQLGDDLAQSRQIWANFPQMLFWYLSVQSAKPAARVLAVHPTATMAGGEPLPILTMQYVGQGLVLFHSTDDTWRWRHKVGDVYFARYWIQAVRYLSRAKLLGQHQQVELIADRQTYRRGEPVEFRVRFPESEPAPEDDQGVSLVVERDGQENRVTLSRNPASPTTFSGIFTPRGDGKFRAWLATPQVRGDQPEINFTVLAPASESERLEMNRRDLEWAAQQSGGKFYTFSTAEQLLDDLPAGVRIPVESRPPKPLWNQWYILLLFLLLLGTEWIARKRLGML